MLSRVAIDVGPEAALIVLCADVGISDDDAEACRRMLEGLKRPFDWGYFIDQAVRHRISALIARNLDRHDIHPGGAGSRMHERLLRASYLYNESRNRALLRELGTVLSALRRCDVRPVLRKGCHLAFNVYPEPAVRYMTDFDVFLPDESLPAAAAVLDDLGYRQGRLSENRRVVRPLAREDELFWKLNVSALPAFSRPTSDPYVSVFSVDVRRNIVERPSGRPFVPMEELFARARPAIVAGEPVLVLAPEDQVIDLATHIFREATTLTPIAEGKDLCLYRFLDLLLVWRDAAAAVNVDELVDSIDRYQLHEDVYYALHFMDAIYPHVVEPSVLERIRPVDLGYLDCYGEWDRQPGRWLQPFLTRLFDSNRAASVTAASPLPRWS